MSFVTPADINALHRAIEANDADQFVAVYESFDDPLHEELIKMFVRQILGQGEPQSDILDYLCRPEHGLLPTIREMFDEVCELDHFDAFVAYTSATGIPYVDYNVTTVAQWVDQGYEEPELMDVNKELEDLVRSIIDRQLYNTLDAILGYDDVNQDIRRLVDVSLSMLKVSDVTLDENLVYTLCRVDTYFVESWMTEFIRLGRLDLFAVAIDAMPSSLHIGRREVIDLLRLPENRAFVGILFNKFEDPNNGYTDEVKRLYAFQVYPFVYPLDEVTYTVERFLTSGMVCYLDDSQLLSRVGMPESMRTLLADEKARRKWVREGMIWSTDVNHLLPSYTRKKILDFLVLMKREYPGRSVRQWTENIRNIVQVDVFNKYTPPLER